MIVMIISFLVYTIKRDEEIVKKLKISQVVDMEGDMLTNVINMWAMTLMMVGDYLNYFFHFFPHFSA